MSLNRAQRAATSAELMTNLELSGLTAEQLRDDLGWSAAELDQTLAVTGADPAMVWMLRDVLEKAILARGLRPEPYSWLIPGMAEPQQRWFGLPLPRDG